MTKEEAIKVLLSKPAIAPSNNERQKKLNEAIDIAIKSLQAETEWLEMERELANLKSKFESAETEWIPVSARLPEMEQKMFAWATVGGEELWSGSEAVLVHHHDKNFPTPYCIAELTRLTGEEPKWNEVETSDVISDVIAWMPLPKPYRKDGEV